MSLSKLTKSLTRTSRNLPFEKFCRDPIKSKQTMFKPQVITLYNFLWLYRDDIMEAYDVCIDDYERDEEFIQIYCIVDTSEDKVNTMDPVMRKRYRRAGKERRDKLKNKYHYENPFNRIHAYAIVEDSPGDSPDDTLSISVICTSNYSDQKGLGSYLMKLLMKAAKSAKYSQLILEVGNDDAAKEEEDLEESEEESEEEEEEESEEEEEDTYEELIDIVSRNLWKKSVRHRDGDPYYSIGDEYIRECVSQYLYDEKLETEPVIILEDEEYGYGGYWYTVGKRNNISLYNYYVNLGFIEDEKVHKEWKCFGDTAFPSMIMKL